MNLAPKCSRAAPCLVLLAFVIVGGFLAKADTAAWYGEEHRGKRMANGQPFDPEQLTAASWFYPLGSVVRVSHGARTVDVIITDRGPAPWLVRRGRVIDLSRRAFESLADPRVGVISVRLQTSARRR